MFLNDLRYAARTLSKTPLFACVAVATLALGIGVNVSMFTVLHAEILRPLPFLSSERLVRVAERNDKLNLPDWTASVLNYLSWKEKEECFEGMGAFGYTSLALTGSGDPEQLAANTLTPGLLSLLGTHPIVGREFREGEDRPGNARVAMLGEAMWRRRFAANPAVVGGDLLLNDEHYTIVGVVPSSFSILSPGDVFVPLVIDPAKERRLNHLITAVARLKPGITLQQAQSMMEGVAVKVGEEHPEVKDWSIRLFTFSEWFVPPPIRFGLLALMGAVTLVLCIACANVASLLLARAVSRRHEVALRLALGATRKHLIRQFLTESFLLASCGGVLGVAFAHFTIVWMSTRLPAGLLPIPGVRMDSSSLLFTLGATVLTAIAFGLGPACFASRADLNEVLKQGSRAQASSPILIRRILTGAEVALATVLLIGALMLLHTLLRMQQVTLGFDSSQLLTFQLTPPPLRYSSQSRAWTFYSRLLESLSAQPGILSATVSSGLPFGNGAYTRTPIAAVGSSVLEPGASLPLDWRAVSPQYLATLKIPVLQGRFFTDQDAENSLAAAVVSQQAAISLWGSESPVGRRIRVVGSGKEFTVIGVIPDAVNTSLNQPIVPAVYFPAAQRLWPTMDVAVRTKGDPEFAIATVRRVLRDLDPELPLATVKTMDQWIAESAARPRLNATVVGLFAASSLVIGIVGIYGVLSFSVSQRTREIGIRMALGARRRDVIQLVLKEGMTVVGLGIGAGILGAAAMGRVISSLLFGIKAHDPISFVSAPLFLAASAVLACYVPARRAAQVDPSEALRQ